MIRSAVMRVLAIAALAGQLQVLPGAWLCVRAHRRPGTASHCQGTSHEAMRTDGAQLVAGAPDAAVPLCAMPGTCSACASTFTAPAVVAAVAAPGRNAASVTRAVVPDSFDPAPTAPPPEA